MNFKVSLYTTDGERFDFTFTDLKRAEKFACKQMEEESRVCGFHIFKKGI